MEAGWPRSSAYANHKANTSPPMTTITEIANTKDMGQNPLGNIAAPRARASHPQTSHDAARSVTELTAKQQAVFKVARCCDGGFTLEGLVNLYKKMCEGQSYDLPKQSDSGIRTRCHELVVLGKVQDSGMRHTMLTGRKAIVWRVAQ